MSLETMHAALELAQRVQPRLVDVTGGAPELWPHIREFVASVRAMGIGLRVRTNLLSLGHAEAIDLPELFARERVALLATLHGADPGVGRAQPGRSSERLQQSYSILRHLAALGYGSAGGPVLEIAHNPPRGRLPRAERALADEYRTVLAPMGVRFERVLSIANFPLGRFADELECNGGIAAYTNRLVAAFNPLTVARLACRETIEVAWDGRLYDCDFNLAAEMPVTDGPATVAEALERPDALANRRISFGAHCFACTVGAGSG